MNMKRRAGILLALLVVFSAGTAAVRLTEQKPQVQMRKVYYLTSMDGAEDVLAVQITNASGMLTMVNSGGQLFTDTAMTGIAPDADAVMRLFDAVSKIQVGDPIEGADPADPQFGLNDPQAVVFIEDADENGLQFAVGDATPAGDAYYVCVSGGDTVYTLSNAYEEALLGSLNRYLDLQVFPAEQLFSDLKRLTFCTEDAGAPVYELCATGGSEVTGIHYYSFTKPFTLPFASAMFQEQLVQRLTQLRAEGVLEQVPEGSSCRLECESADGTVRSFTLVHAAADPTLWCVTEEASGIHYAVRTSSAADSLVQADMAKLLGGKLLALNASGLEHLTMEAGDAKTEIEISGSNNAFVIVKDGISMEFAEFSAKILEHLNRISIEPLDAQHSESADAASAAGTPLLRCTIVTRGETTALSFIEADGRKCIVYVGGQPAFLCDLSAIEPLIQGVIG